MKRSDWNGLMAVLWLIAASVNPEDDWSVVVCMALFAWYSIACAVHRLWIERREVKP